MRSDRDLTSVSEPARPAVVDRVRESLDDAAARHGGRVRVTHSYVAAQQPGGAGRVAGWQSRVQVAGVRRRPVDLWCAVDARDLMVLGGADLAGWRLDDPTAERECRAALGQLVDDFVAGRLPVDRTSELARTGAVVTLLATAAAATALAVASVIAGRGKR
ncbi:hypothetical protein [Frigoribacterium sp. CFBP 13707]|uniref:hypothetical protein n=1 Tax=Frigoribacterium sp. CFBP 13707 TaxID=2775313 RepID=UPI00177B5DFE|nr:hypothetical protein [Frigoribacterium sp. CFBP 13707]MBD8728232.1 hypothetical protein [Frigoribacterium sp. CFBP 13707]